MNQKQKEFLKNAKEISWGKAKELEYDGIYFIPLRKKHDSGYNLLEVVGEIIKDRYEWEYFIIDYCDVIDFEAYHHLNNTIRDIHIDCKDGIFHIWSNTNKLKPVFLVSNAVFEMGGKHK